MSNTAEDTDLPQPGDVLNDKYAIVRIVGKGGMGVVYEGTHLKLDQRVAVKMMLRTDAAELTTRFEREARAASKLTGPNVARVMDVDVTKDGRPFMVMEFLEGQNLGAELEARGPLPVAEAVDYVLEACAAMRQAHEHGIVHRDLKPENLFLCQEQGVRRVKVLDFGISRVPTQGESRVTVTTSSLGTPLYMSPEQIRSAKGVDERTDIWSLGVILYECVAGATPFSGDSATAVIAAISADDAAPLRKSRPDVPAPFERVVMKCLAKKPAERFQSIDELARALLPFAEHATWGAVGRPSLVPSLPRAIAESTADTVRDVGLGHVPDPLGETDASGPHRRVDTVPATPAAVDDAPAASRAALTNDGTVNDAPARSPGARLALAVAAVAAVAIVTVVGLRSGDPDPPKASPLSAAPATGPAPSAAQPASTATSSAEPPATAAPDTSSTSDASSSGGGKLPTSPPTGKPAVKPAATQSANAGAPPPKPRPKPPPGGDPNPLHL